VVGGVLAWEQTYLYGMKPGRTIGRVLSNQITSLCQPFNCLGVANIVSNSSKYWNVPLISNQFNSNTFSRILHMPNCSHQFK